MPAYKDKAYKDIAYSLFAHINHYLGFNRNPYFDIFTILKLIFYDQYLYEISFWWFGYKIVLSYFKHKFKHKLKLLHGD